MPGLPRDPERWQRIKRLFDAAVALPAEERARYVEKESGDEPELRAQVEELIEADRQAGDFLETPAFETVDSADLLAALGTLGIEGRQFGPYEVVREVGAGGMGTVYEAIDGRLRRRVALKILSRAYMRDQEARTRFMREARAASKLDHPNICPVHDIGTTSGGRLFLVMPLYQGQSIRDRIEAGPIPPEQARDLALQVLRGLQRAHEAGITHRDIKPANLLLTEHDDVKIVDFGIAKFPDEVDITQAHQSLGTPAYMSPEQARGEPVDARSDLFSLGVVLYEMVAGKHPFAADTREGLVRAILHRPHEPLMSAAPGSPVDISAAADRLLEKNPIARFATASEALDALAPSAKWDRGKRGRLIAAAAAVVALALGVGYWAPRSDVPATGSPPLTVEEAVVTWGSDERDGRLSPDGRFISFISDRGGQENLWIRPVAGGTPRRITDLAEPLVAYAWSPDGEQIVYAVRLADRSLLQLVSSSGGPARRTVNLDGLSERIQLVRWVGTSVYLVHATTLYRADLESGLAERVLATSGLHIREADLTADGRRLVFTAAVRGVTDLWTADLETGDIVQRTVDEIDRSHPLWLGAADEAIVYQADTGGDTALWRMDLRSGRRDLLLAGVGRGRFHVSRDASLVLLTREREGSDIWQFDPSDGSRTRLTDNSLLEFWPSSSGEAGRVVFQRTKSRPSPTYDLFDAELIAAQWLDGRFVGERPIVPSGFSPLFSLAGRWVAFLRLPPAAGRAELWAHDLRLQQDLLIAENVRLGGWHMFPLSWRYRTVAWAHRSQTLFFVAGQDNAPPAIQAVTVAEPLAERERVVTAPAATQIHDIAISRDDKLLSYVLRRGEPGLWELRIRGLDLAGEPDRAVFSGEEPLDDLRSIGWLGGEDALVFLTSSFAPPSRVRGVEVFLVDSAGAVARVGKIEEAIPGTAVLDPRGIVYLVRVEERIHNIYALSLDSGTWRRVTSNDSPGVSFAGLHVREGGDILYARHVLQRDISAIRVPAGVGD